MRADNDCKFVMSCVLMVGCMDSPTIPGDIHTSSTRIYHWLYADYHPVHKPAPMTRSSIIRDSWFFVHLLAKSVAFKLADNRETE